MQTLREGIGPHNCHLSGRVQYLGKLHNERPPGISPDFKPLFINFEKQLLPPA